MKQQAHLPTKCPACQYRKAASEFREPGTGLALPACKSCLRKELNQKMRVSWAEQKRLADRCNQMTAEIRELRRDLYKARNGESHPLDDIKVGMSSNSGGRRSPVRPLSKGGSNGW